MAYVAMAYVSVQPEDFATQTQTTNSLKVKTCYIYNNGIMIFTFLDLFKS